MLHLLVCNSALCSCGILLLFESVCPGEKLDESVCGDFSDFVIKTLALT